MHCAARADRTIVMCVCAEIENLNLFRVLFFAFFVRPTCRQSITRLPTRSLSLILSFDLFSFLSLSLSFVRSLSSSSSSSKQWTHIPSIKNNVLVTSVYENEHFSRKNFSKSSTIFTRRNPSNVKENRLKMSCHGDKL